jgi:flagellar export protein FliJ
VAVFRFRPQAALDLRRRQVDAAQLAVAEARAGSERAEAAVAAAQAAFDAAAARARTADAAGGDVTVAIWYRNWIKSQRRELARTEAIAEERRVSLAAADAALVEARRRVRVLERLRERAEAAHQQRERQHEQRALDELANLQFAIRQRGDQP